MKNNVRAEMWQIDKCFQPVAIASLLHTKAEHDFFNIFLRGGEQGILLSSFQIFERMFVI